MEEYNDKVLINEVRDLLKNGETHSSISALLLKRGLSSDYIERIIHDSINLEINNTNLHQNTNSYINNKSTTFIDQANNYNSASIIQSNSQNTNLNNNQNNLHNTDGVYQNNVNNIKVEHTHKLSFGSILLVFSLLLILIAYGLFYFIEQQKTEAFLLDYELKLLRNSFVVGENLEFNTKYSNMGRRTQYDVFTTYKVIDQSGDIVMEWTETKAVANVQNYHIIENIPLDINPGRYYILSEVDYGRNQKAIARTLFFQINSNQDEVINHSITPIPDNQTNNDSSISNFTNDSITRNDSDIINNISQEITQDAISNNISNESVISQQNIITDNQTTTQPIFNNNNTILQQQNREDTLQIINQAKTFSTSNPEDSINICLSLEELSLVDNCFQQIAKFSKNHNFCEQIQSSFTRDFCYVNYVTDTQEYSKCDLINSERTKRSCNFLNPQFTG